MFANNNWLLQQLYVGYLDNNSNKSKIELKNKLFKKNQCIINNANVTFYITSNTVFLLLGRKTIVRTDNAFILNLCFICVFLYRKTKKKDLSHKIKCGHHRLFSKTRTTRLESVGSLLFFCYVTRLLLSFSTPTSMYLFLCFTIFL